MSTLVSAAFDRRSITPDRFVEDVRHGLGGSGQKRLPSTYLYDELGSALFEAITLLPEYGLTRADEALLREHSPEIAQRCGSQVTVAELGSGSGSKTRNILSALGSGCLAYYPIDVSGSALARNVNELSALAEVRPVEANYLDGLGQVLTDRPAAGSLLVLFLGSTIGNFDSAAAPEFLSQIRSRLRPSDHLLVGADLVKPRQQLVSAYDDATGVTAAFNLNLLGRINRELDADFNLRSFEHEARWNEREQRVEMHLSSRIDQTVQIRSAELKVEFHAGETIWTESSHKFTVAGLNHMAAQAGFKTEAMWVHAGWPFAECLWSAV